ncbi:ATP-binding protein [Thermoactinomyces sp. DSM 45891]|uniref:sensor histidine kinase n=1 Tax=Thermoactinomyces sp. DSM 45891 TaxID=1761907 RepID=UPI0009315747|nr:ATP-binding protein [Thermoactinomyces sp. DSM 45891]
MHRITTKWLLAILGIMILGLTLLGTVSYWVITNHYQSYAEITLGNQASSFAEILKVDFDPKTLKHVAAMETKSSSTVFVFSPEGDLFISSKSTKPQLLEVVQNWVRQDLNQKSIQKKVALDGIQIILAKSPIERGKNRLGTVVVGTELTWLENALQSLQAMLILAGLGALLVASGLGLLLSRSVVRPILDVVKTIGQLAKGNYQVRILVEGKDELALLNQQVNQLAESLSYYQSSRREFLSHVAHELRTPITYLKGYATLLQNPEIELNRAQKLTSIIREQSDRLDRLVNDLMTLSRVDEGQLELKKEQVELGELLQKICDEMRIQAGEWGVKLVLNIHQPPLYLSLDPQRFYQIMMNLIDNAVRYSHGKGTVTISVQKKSNEMMIQVRDEGIGMSEKELNRVWERFYRVEKSRSRHTGGSGLGLSIVKHLVGLQGGRIDVKSIPNRGTTFLLYFPHHQRARSE